MPVIPLILINGADGIGTGKLCQRNQPTSNSYLLTGWSTSIPNYNPRDVVDNIRRLMHGEPQVPMHPWYRGFKVCSRPAPIQNQLTLINRVLLKKSQMTSTKWLALSNAPIMALISRSFLFAFGRRTTRNSSRNGSWGAKLRRLSRFVCSLSRCHKLLTSYIGLPWASYDALCIFRSYRPRERFGESRKWGIGEVFQASRTNQHQQHDLFRYERQD